MNGKPFLVNKIATLGNRVFGVPFDTAHPEYTAEQGINSLDSFFHEIGMPTSFIELGAKEEDVDKLAAKCFFNNGDKLGFFNPLTRDECKEVYRLACK
jgi:alcohol dehydrogenase YqhD (iron-dependent ADH family)